MTNCRPYQAVQVRKLSDKISLIILIYLEFLDV